MHSLLEVTRIDIETNRTKQENISLLNNLIYNFTEPINGCKV